MGGDNKSCEVASRRGGHRRYLTVLSLDLPNLTAGRAPVTDLAPSLPGCAICSAPEHVSTQAAAARFLARRDVEHHAEDWIVADPHAVQAGGSKRGGPSTGTARSRSRQNYIKHQARAHDGFRKTCVSFAQSLHRLDMRLRLGLLQEPAAIERQIAREAQEAAAKKAKAEIPTVKTEAQTKADEVAKVKDKEKAKEKQKGPHIRPLSEAKAIDSGANFISETFLFSVGLSLILVETWRSRRKETNRRNDVADKLAELEARDQEKERALHAMEAELDELRGRKGGSASNWHLPGSSLFTSSRTGPQAAGQQKASKDPPSPTAMVQPSGVSEAPPAR